MFIEISGKHNHSRVLVASVCSSYCAYSAMCGCRIYFPCWYFLFGTFGKGIVLCIVQFSLIWNRLVLWKPIQAVRCEPWVHLGSVIHVRLGAGCFDALIQSSTLQNNWPAVEQGPLFWQPLPAVSQHITLPLGGQKGAISSSSDLANTAFAELALTKYCPKHSSVSLVCVSVINSVSKWGSDYSWQVLHVQVCRQRVKT